MTGLYSTTGTGQDRTEHGMTGGQVMTGQNMAGQVGTFQPRQGMKGHMAGQVGTVQQRQVMKGHMA